MKLVISWKARKLANSAGDQMLIYPIVSLSINGAMCSDAPRYHHTGWPLNCVLTTTRILLFLFFN